MSRRRTTRNHFSQERWLVSYADFITLLFAFFVVLFASSRLDSRKSGTMATSIQSAFRGVKTSQAAGSAWAVANAAPLSPRDPAEAVNPLEEQLKSALSSELDQEFVSLETGTGELTLSLKEVGFFDSGSAVLRETSAASIGRIAAVLAGYSNAVRIEGHTDNIPIATARFASNWELSTARAIEITRLLTTRYGIEPARLSVAGFAEHRPVESNRDAPGRAANRRVDIVIIGPIADPAAN